jgi:ATP-dependent DNA helicase RecQ
VVAGRVQLPLSASSPERAGAPDLAAALAVFGHAAFRVGQAEAAAAVAGGRDALVLLPTGGGKSLCYQVPALARFRAGLGTTLVVSPLIALMIDQVEALRARGVAAAALSSAHDEDSQREAIRQLMAGELALLYVSPERAAQAGFRRLLGRAPISAIAVDEAHCISQWGHDFRPEYQALGELRALPGLERAPIIAVTATATPRVLAEIASSLRLHAPTLVQGDFARPNLAFAVAHVRADAARIAALIAAADELGLRARAGAGRAIVYCPTRKKAESVSSALREQGFAATHYHAGRTTLARDRAQRAFAGGRTRVLVATSAFGMGIDYSDVRLIVHMGAPGSVEAYYQEAGRAGRDGEPARCLLLFGDGDLVTQRRLAGRNAGARVDAALAAMRGYATSTRCRQADLCGHFTGRDDHAACGRCDVCTGVASEAPAAAPAAAPAPPHARAIVLAACAELPRPVGKGTLAKALRGSAAKAVVAAGLTGLPQAGALADVEEASLVALLDELLAERVLVRRGKKFPTIWLAGRAEVRRGADVASAPARATPRREIARRAGGIVTTDVSRELQRLRRRLAKQLAWKEYMVMQRATIAAIDQARPTTLGELERIRGLGPAKIARFGADILDVVRRGGR